jgi:hypothetical protein
MARPNVSEVSRTDREGRYTVRLHARRNRVNVLPNPPPGFTGGMMFHRKGETDYGRVVDLKPRQILQLDFRIDPTKLPQWIDIRDLAPSTTPASK